MTLGSLFDGISGFPLAGIYLGITPIWASEKDNVPISISRRHFQNMKQLGDVTKINGEDIDPVDIITFGTPCQDLSMAGNRKGLAGERSGLFFEAIRIIKEMRGKTNGAYPTFAVWENVYGAFSSNEGYDFLSVLQEFSAIAEPGISILRPALRGGATTIEWFNAGAIMGDSWSLAWRILDAQYWGVPQRRRRIFLVADFRDRCAGEILFKSESVSRNFTESGTERKGTSSNFERNIRAAGFIGCQGAKANGIGYAEELSPTIKSEGGGNTIPAVMGINDQGGDNINVEKSDVSPCLRSETHGNLPVVLEQQYAVDFGRVADRIQMNPKIAVTLQAEGGGCGAKTGLYCLPQKADTLAFSFKSFGQYEQDSKSQTRKERSDFTSEDLIIDNHAAMSCDFRNFSASKELSGTLQAKPNGGQSLNCINPICIATGQANAEILEDLCPTLSCNHEQPIVGNNYEVRRLTPIECERLQGFPDGWTEFGLTKKSVLQKISDSARYKVLGNSVAIPCVYRILLGIKEVSEKLGLIA
jgi:DNA (cytosine-5)-methyltransferase 1